VAEFDLTALEIAPCRGCFDCWIKTPGLCFTRDAMDGVLRELARAEFAFWITPIAFGGYGYHLKKALDRSIPILLPFFIKIGGEVHHPLRYDVKRRLAVLGTLPAPDPESERIFHGLVARNSINLHAGSVCLVLQGNAADGRWEDKLDGLAALKEARS
jgi:multimeric flavodoxin WrbA